MKTVYTGELVSKLTPTRHTMEKWVTRGFLNPNHKPEGRRGRQWTFREAMQIEILAVGAAQGAPLRELAKAGTFLVLPRDETRFLVLGYAQHSHEGMIDHFNADIEIVEGQELSAHLMQARCESYDVIPLLPIADRLRKVFAN